MNSKELHQNKVANLQREMREFYEKGQKVRIYHGTTNSTRTQRFKKKELIDISNLTTVLEVNTKEKYVLVEPNVPMDALVDATLPFGYIPAVVMEFPGITVGGGIQGGAGESSSFKYGLFHDICLSYEVLLADGSIVTCSPNENADLFYGIPSSYGSLGIITLAKVKLVEAKPYVHLTYTKCGNASDLLTCIHKTIHAASTDYLDGIIYSDTFSVCIEGKLVDNNKKLPIHTFNRRQDEWYYLHVNKKTRNQDLYEELVPLKEYLFRYDRGGFWVGSNISQVLKIPFNRLTRYLFDRYFTTRKLYRALQTTNMSQQYVIQDLSIPAENANTFFEYIKENFPVYPIWVCPLNPKIESHFSPSALQTEVVINFGIWGGERIQSYERFVEVNRNIENKVKQLGGRKVLYAHTYYKEEEFWNIYNKEVYDNLRSKYGGKKVFPSIFEKVRVVEQYKPSLLKGLLKAKRSRILSIED